MKPLHLPITGDELLSVARFRDDTRHMAEYLVLSDCAFGTTGAYVRRFLTERGYAELLEAQRQRSIQIRKHANIIEGHILPDKPKKHQKHRRK